MSTDNYTHPQLDRLTSVIYTARWLTAIRNSEMATDREIAKAILKEGFVIPQATVPRPILPTGPTAPATMSPFPKPEAWHPYTRWTPDYSAHPGKPHEDCCK